MLTKIGGEAIEGSYYSNHYSHADPSERIQTVIADYRAAYNATPDSLAALGYDAVPILRAAIERSPSLSGKDLAAAIAATKEAKCVTGVITLNAQRNAVKPAVILKVEGGTTKYCATVEPPK